MAAADRDETTRVMRHHVVAALTACARGDELPDPRNTKNPWTPRYFVRRTAWHVLDHAWEIEDRLTK